jgi:hypothetical protein
MIATSVPPRPEPDFPAMQSELGTAFMMLAQKLHRYRATLPLDDPRRLDLVDAWAAINARMTGLFAILDAGPTAPTIRVITLVISPTDDIVVL